MAKAEGSRRGRGSKATGGHRGRGGDRYVGLWGQFEDFGFCSKVGSCLFCMWGFKQKSNMMQLTYLKAHSGCLLNTESGVG